MNKSFLLLLVLIGCGKSGGGGSGACAASPINGYFHATIDNSKTLHLDSSCVATMSSSSCQISYSYPYNPNQSGSLNVKKISSSAGCGQMPDTDVCSYQVTDPNHINLVCVNIPVRAAFVRYR